MILTSIPTIIIAPYDESVEPRLFDSCLPSLFQKKKKELSGVFVPAAKGFDDKRLEEDPLGSAIVEVVANLSGFAHLDGHVCSADGRNDADI